MADNALTDDQLDDAGKIADLKAQVTALSDELSAQRSGLVSEEEQRRQHGEEFLRGLLGGDAA
jgi:hypothetical protein